MCPRCASRRVVEAARAYMSAHLHCLACDYRWRMRRGGRIEEVSK